MQNIEPYYGWRHLYTAETDPNAPFYGRAYSEFEYADTIYNYYIHPQWDFFGSKTLYAKLLFADYEQGFAVIELIGEWNDAIENDIETLRRNLTDNLFDQGITKFALIAENVFNFHSSDDSYYEDWYERVMDEMGWVTIINLPDSSKIDFVNSRITRYVEFVNLPAWRTWKPEILLQSIEDLMQKKLPL